MGKLSICLRNDTKVFEHKAANPEVGMQVHGVSLYFTPVFKKRPDEEEEAPKKNPLAPKVPIKLLGKDVIIKLPMAGERASTDSSKNIFYCPEVKYIA